MLFALFRAPSFFDSIASEIGNRYPTGPHYYYAAAAHFLNINLLLLCYSNSELVTINCLTVKHCIINYASLAPSPVDLAKGGR